ncbi:MAG: methyltransferase domain-containing protein [Thermoplasmata archaeon]|nr:methyltransferase domain-containing protein [Thermoplasmata archaeon]
MESPSGAETLVLETSHDRIRLRYVAEPPFYYVLASGGETHWSTEVLRTGRAKIAIGSVAGVGSATLVTDPATRARLIQRFRDTAGLANAERWYGRPGRLISIDPRGESGSTEPYGRWLRAEFDGAAPEYRTRLDRNPVELRYRSRSLALLRRTFPDHGRLLEIGSGTGAETLPMLRAGHRVVAVDLSPGMLAKLAENAAEAGWAGELTTRTARARDLGALVPEFGAASFDGGYSTFGAMNLEPDLGTFARALGELLRPGARFVAGVYNRHALVGPLAAVLGGSADRIRSRYLRPAPVGTHRFSVDVYFRSVREIRNVFAPEFSLVGLEGLGVVLPPPEYAARWDRWGTAWDRLDRWDRRLTGPRRLGPLADVFFAVLRRTGAAG